MKKLQKLLSMALFLAFFLASFVYGQDKVITVMSNIINDDLEEVRYVTPNTYISVPLGFGTESPNQSLQGVDYTFENSEEISMSSFVLNYYDNEFIPSSSIYNTWFEDHDVVDNCYHMISAANNPVYLSIIQSFKDIYRLGEMRFKIGNVVVGEDVNCEEDLSVKISDSNNLYESEVLFPILKVCPEVLRGDLNNDGEFLLPDAILFLNTFYSDEEFTVLHSLRRDVTGDGLPTMFDFLMMLRKLANPNFVFPVYSWNKWGHYEHMIESPEPPTIGGGGSGGGKGSMNLSLNDGSLFQNFSDLIYCGEFEIELPIGVSVELSSVAQSYCIPKEDGNIYKIAFANINGLPANEPLFVLHGDHANEAIIRANVNEGRSINVIVNSITDIGDESESNLPKNFTLSQNYPNPFNPTTTISYSLSEAGFVNLAVYNMLGEEIVSLVNEVIPAGSHVVEFSAENLSSGTYLYKLSTDKFSETKKMILLK